MSRDLPPKKPAPAAAKDIDGALDRILRPKTLQEYVGQTQLKKMLRIAMAAALKRGEPLEHLLFYGPAGLGKTTLAMIIASEMAVPLRATSGPAIEKAGDLAAVLTNLPPNGVLFIDEIHGLNRAIEEILYPAMEEFSLDIIIGKGPSAQTLKLELPRFTLVAATTRIGGLSSPLRSRFGATHHIGYYNEAEIAQIIERSARLLVVPIDDKAVAAIAQRSRATPRIANRLLKRVRDFAQVEADGQVTPAIVKEAMALLEIDELGLERTDRRLLKTLIENFSGGPVGLNTLAASTAEEENTIEDVYEPYLLQIGLIARTPKGRVATPRAYQHLGLKAPKSADRLL